MAQSTSSPGVGAGTGLMLAIGASLLSMVAGHTKGDETEHRELADVRGGARSLRQDAFGLTDLDASESRVFGAAFMVEPSPERDAATSRASG